eukprot:4836453-Prymnesium_polylepis.1
MTRDASTGYSSFLTKSGWRPTAVARVQTPNYELAEAVCVGPEALRQYVRRARGWAAVREGSRHHPKPGYATSSPSNDLA